MRRIRRRLRNKEDEHRVGNTTASQSSNQRPLWWKLPLQILPLFITAAPISLIFILSSRYKKPTTRTSIRSSPNKDYNPAEAMFGNCPNRDQKAPSSDPPSIVYTDVTTSYQKGTGAPFQRFAATEECDDGTSVPVSILRWSYLLSTYGSDLIEDMVHLMKESSFDGFYFETKGVSSTNANEKQFEFVLVDAPHLYSFADKSNDPITFQEYLEKCDDGNAYGCTFANLGGDAVLIAPKNLQKDAEAQPNAYGHFAAFVRRAPKKQVIKVLQLAISTYYDQLVDTASNNRDDKADKDNSKDAPNEAGNQKDQTQNENISSTNSDPVWFSTSGDGVAWLHFRLDSRPKYYQYGPFKIETRRRLEPPLPVIEFSSMDEIVKL